jgi:glyoxylase I family protein
MTKSKNITGIGGFFFRCKNPKELKECYINSLGINIQEMVWMQEAGATVFEPFPENSDYFNEEKKWMINFRVKDLKKLISELDEKGIKVEQKDEWNSMHVYMIQKEIQLNFGNPQTNEIHP